jgi:hypothetical protein
VWAGDSCDASSTLFDVLFHNHETAVNRTAATNGLLNIVHDFSQFTAYTSTFPGTRAASLVAEGRLLLANWTPRTPQLLWADIANGAYDVQYIDPTAINVRNYGRTVFMAFHTEPDGDISENGGTFGTAQDYVNAHRHIRARFDLAGVSNVVWVWNTASYFATMGLQSGTAFNRMYPGDAYIDWLGFDPYSTGASGGWEDFTQVFGTKYPFVQWSRGTNGGGINKCPALVTPTGVTVVPQGATGATTYGYRVTALNQQGETLASSTVSIANGNATLNASNFNRITWSAQNATYYKVYGRTSGSELFITTITAPTVTYDDKGVVVTPAGALPGSNTATSNLAMPVFIPEWGAEENGGIVNGGTYPNTKQGFFDQVRAGLKNEPYASAIKALVYFNSTSGTGDCYNTGSNAITGYKALLADPFYNPDMTPTPPPSASGQFRAGNSAVLNGETSKQITIPATVQAGDQLLLFAGFSRAALRNALEGTNAANITTGNSNSNGSNPFDSISGTAPTYDTSQKHTLTSSMLASVTSGTDAHGDWTTSFGSPSTYNGAAYIRRTAAPTNPTRIFQQNNVGGGTNQWGLALDTSGNLIVRDLPAGATRLTVPGGALAINTWHRVEWQAVWNGSTTTVTVRLYRDAIADEFTLDDSGTSTAFTQAAAPGKYSFGHLSSVSQTYAVNVDDVALDTSNWLGPAGTPAVATTPAGWTLMTPAVDNVSGPIELRSYFWRKTASSGDPGSTVTVTLDSKVHGALELVAYSGINGTTPIDQFASSTAATNGTTATSPNVTTTGAGEFIVTAAFDRANPGTAATSAWTAPSGDTLRTSSYGTGTDGRVSGMTSDDGVGHGVGTYGSKVATANVTSFLRTAWTVALIPSGSSGGTQFCGFLVN